MKNTPEASKSALWTGRVLSSLLVLFLALDGVMKLVKPAPVVEATTKLGYPESSITGMGVTLLVCTALYAFRRTSILGAVLLTGYFGGAVATHVRAGAPVGQILFALFFGGLVWLGLYVRDAQLRATLPLRGGSAETVVSEPLAGTVAA